MIRPWGLRQWESTCKGFYCLEGDTMKILFKTLLIFSLVTTASFGAFAHTILPEDPGVLHILKDFRHILGFSILGVFAGLYIKFFGGRLYVYAIMIPFIMIEMFAHISMVGELRLQFALGFLSCGFFVALLASNLAGKAVAKLKRSTQDGRKRVNRGAT